MEDILNGLVSTFSHLAQTPYITCDQKIKALAEQKAKCLERIFLISQKGFFSLAMICFYPMYALGKTVEPIPVHEMQFTSVTEEAAVEEYERICAEEDTLFQGIDTRGEEPTNRIPYYEATLLFDKTVIAAEDPSHSTKTDFWKMVWKWGADRIISFSDQVYWPKKLHRERIAPSVSISTLDEEQTCYRDLKFVTRQFLFRNGNSERWITQHQFCDWKEESCSKDLANFAAFVQQCKARLPLIVHCCNGIEKSGIFLAIYESYRRFLEGITDPHLVENTVRELRNHETGRDGMIENEKQYQLVHKTLAELLHPPT